MGLTIFCLDTILFTWVCSKCLGGGPRSVDDRAEGRELCLPPRHQHERAQIAPLTLGGQLPLFQPSLQETWRGGDY